MDNEAQKELEHLNNELLMRMQKGYGDGAMLVSFSLIYFVTVIGVLIKFVECSELGLKDICIFNALSIMFFLFPIFIYYAMTTRNRENFSALFNVATYKKIFFENYTLSDGILSGGKWEHFHKTTYSAFFDKGNNEVFFLSILSMALYIGSFFLMFYYTFIYLQQNSTVLSFVILISVNFLNVVCFIPIINRIVKLHGLFSPNYIGGEIESMNTYYNIQYWLIKIAKNTDELNELVEKLKGANEKFNSFLIAAHIPLYKAIDLERLFYSFVFPSLSDIAPSEEHRKKDELIKYVSALAEKKQIDVYNFICDFSKFQKNPTR